MSKGVISMGIHCPIIREGDDLQQIVIDSILRTTELEDGDVIGITESVVARSQGNYVTVDEIAAETERLFGKLPIIQLYEPIYSRNRFAIILKGIARACSAVIITMPEYDEVGNPRGVNPWTGVNIMDYYKKICKEERCDCIIDYDGVKFDDDERKLYISLQKEIELEGSNILICNLHHFHEKKLELLAASKEFGIDSLTIHTLDEYFPGMCGYGLLGSNKATEEKVKLFPNITKAKDFVDTLQNKIFKLTGKLVQCMVYGDGAFKDPSAEIWEFADPVTTPAYTIGLEGSPNEIKIKAFADDKFAELNGEELEEAIKKEIASKKSDLKGEMTSQGTTPRRYIDLLASLMDLTSGSGDKGTPVVLVKNYFKNYSC